MHSVIDGKRKSSGLAVLVSLFILFVLAGHYVLMAESDQANGVLRSRAYKFSNITSQQAHEFLSQLSIGTGYDVLNDNVLIVTSNKDKDLIKASEVLSVLDQPTPVGIWPLMVGNDQQPLPNVDELAAQMLDFTVGTMTDAPPKGAKNPVILDILGNKLIAIGAESLLPEIEKAVNTWKEANPSGQPPAAPVEQPQVAPAEDAEKTQKTAAEQPTVKEDVSLQEIMARLLEQEQAEQSLAEGAEAKPKEQAEPKEEDLLDMLDNEPNTTEEYIGDELLRVLLDEEKKSQPQEPAEPEVAVKAKPEPKIQPEPQTEQPSQQAAQEPELGDQKSLEEAIKMLLGQQQEQQPEPQAAQAKPKAAQPALEPKQPSERPEMVSENLRLQRELAILRQQLAQAQGQKGATAPDESHAAAMQKVQTQVETADLMQEEEPTLTEFEKAVGETELETIVNLPQEVELDNLVDLVGEQLGLNYMYDENIFRNQKVLLKIHEGKIKVKDLYGLLESVLRFKGYVMTRRDNLVTILKANDVNQVYNQTDTVIRMPGDPIQPGDIIVSTIFQLENIPAASAKKVLADMKLGLNNGFQEIAETNTLIVTDYSYRMSRIEEVLSMIDIAGEEKVFKHRDLKYMQAADLVTKLKDLVSQMEGVSMQVGDAKSASAAAAPTRYTTQRKRNPQTGKIETVRVPVGGAQPQNAAAGGDGGDETVFIDTDERTNRLLMIGTQDQIDIINQLVDTLDVPQHGLKFVREYVIQYVEAVEVVNVLNELGLADLNVSGSSSTQSTTSRSSAARRTAAARSRGQEQPQANAAASSTPSVSGGEDQPDISIRPATNSLLVNGTEEQHLAIELVIAHVDVVQKDQRTIREYEIQYVDTQEIIDTMTELGIISQQSSTYSATQQRGRTSSRTSRTSQQQPTAAVEGGAPTGLQGLAGEAGSSEDITAQEPQIAVLEATNSLLVYATPRQHKAISLLIAHADRVPTTTTTPYVVYALENQDPIELAEVLTKLIQETVEEVGKAATPQSKVQTSTSGALATSSVPNLEEQKIRIIPDEMSYSLIVYANKRNQQWIAELIEELDEYRPQVLLDCTLVEITKDDQFKFELDLISKTYSDLTLRPGTSGSIGGTTTTIGNLGGSSSFSVDRYAHAATSAGTLTGFFNSDMIQGLLTAMQKDDYGRIMARPKVLVNDNQEGEIKTENTKSIAQVKTITNLPDSGSAVTSTDVSFNEYKEGITLNIKPHISKGDMLRLEITLNRTDFEEQAAVEITTADGDQSYPSPPDLLSTDLFTVATVPDGTTIILGGLEDIAQGKTHTKVPILGDLPLVGGLFRDVSDTDTQGKLYVFVKANIIRPGDQVEGLKDIRRVSGKYRKEFENMEKRFQEMQDWPGVDPEPMDPLKVLEEDEIIDLTAP